MLLARGLGANAFGLVFSDLSSVYFNEPLENLISYLKAFKKLGKVKLSKVKCEDVLKMVNEIGYQIFHLELVCLRESLNLTEVAVKCPNLQILEIYYSMAVHVSSPINFNFPCLQKLVIYCTDVHGFDSQQVCYIYKDAFNNYSKRFLEARSKINCQRNLSHFGPKITKPTYYKNLIAKPDDGACNREPESKQMLDP